ncbi:MAG TPA: hypothetical protein VHW74_11515 [Mycobacteriales bacterium]|nr:hypothetical protein [Mycobacteriales bacterium]
MVSDVAPLPTRLVDSLIARRYYVLFVIAAAIWLDTGHAVHWQGHDWSYFLVGARALTGHVGLHVYARMPQLQFGPPALLVPVVFRDVGPGHGWAVVSALGMLLGLVAIRLLEDTAAELVGRSRRLEICVLVGGAFFLAVWASPAVSWGHPDDVLALLAIAAALRAVGLRRWLVGAALIGAAAAAKPWALLALPLAMAGKGYRVRGFLLAIAVAIVTWVPFLIADHETRRVGDLHLRVEETSTLHYLGLAVGAAPTWPRDAQLAVALVIGGLAVARGRWLLVPFVAFAVRINLDPSVVYYYAAGPVLGAFVWDLVEPIRQLPVRTVATWFGLLAFPSAVLQGGTGDTATHAMIAALRIAALVVAVWVAVRAGPTRDVP